MIPKENSGTETSTIDERKKIDDRWHTTEVSLKEALVPLRNENLSAEKFEQATEILRQETLRVPNGETAYQHDLQVLSVMNELISTNDDLFPGSPEDKETYYRLATLIVLLHDKEKDLTETGPLRDILHAHRSAQAATGHLQRLLGNSEEIEKMGFFAAQVIERHSDIPYIQGFFEKDEVKSLLMDYDTRDLPKFEIIPVDEEGNPIEIRVVGYISKIAGYKVRLPTPDDALNEDVSNWAHALRAADTLSNYCVDEEADVKAEDPEIMMKYKYAGFIKIIGLNKGAMSERIGNTMINARKAIDKGIYDKTPQLKDIALRSIENMKRLQNIFNLDEMQGLNDLGEEYGWIIEDPNAPEEEKEFARAEIIRISIKALNLLENEIALEKDQRMVRSIV